jgi:hypothetical protein
MAISPLPPIAIANTVRCRASGRTIPDVPFIETREQLGGFFTVEAENLDKAIAIAGRIKAARKSCITICAAVQIPGLPD